MQRPLHGCLIRTVEAAEVVAGKILSGWFVVWRTQKAPSNGESAEAIL